MTVYQSSHSKERSKPGAHRKATRTDRLIDWFRFLVFETGYRP